jgi:hypothetical protein
MFLEVPVLLTWGLALFTTTMPILLFQLTLEQTGSGIIPADPPDQ